MAFEGKHILIKDLATNRLGSLRRKVSVKLKNYYLVSIMGSED